MPLGTQTTASPVDGDQGFRTLNHDQRFRPLDDEEGGAFQPIKAGRLGTARSYGAYDERH
jgi:hypothetical protein